MKVKEYVLKYDLTKSKEVNHRELASDLTLDLIALLEVGDGLENSEGFNSAVRAFRVKFDSLNNIAIEDLTKLWDHIFAPVIEIIKEELFPGQKKMCESLPIFW